MPGKARELAASPGPPPGWPQPWGHDSQHPRALAAWASPNPPRRPNPPRPPQPQELPQPPARHPNPKLPALTEARVNCSLHPLLLEGSPSCPNLYANWVVILLLVTFLLVTNVLLMNLLIAMFSYTFQAVQGNADTFWKSQRFHLIVEYHQRPALAPPFILLSHMSLVLKRLLQRGAPQKRARLERDLPEPLDQKVVTWEVVQKENFLSELEKRRKESQGELLRKAAHRVDVIAKLLGGLREQERRVKRLESQVGYCAALLSSVAESLALGSAYWNSRNPPASADHGGALGSRERPEAGQPPSNP